MTDPYTEVADYIASRVTLLDYGTWLVKLSLDDCFAKTEDFDTVEQAVKAWNGEEE